MKAKSLLFSSLKIILKSVLGLILFIFLYLLFSFILARIPINLDAKNTKKGIDIYLLSNGVHTDLILPIKSQEVDWSEIIPSKNVRNNDSTYNYLAFGWGDKGFYLNTPTWAELKASTAFNATCGLSTSAFHTTYYTKIRGKKENLVKLNISTKNYKKLISYIKKSFIFDIKGEAIFIPTKAVYGDHDAFYEAKGNYSLFSTCNTWTNNALKSANQKASFWTPFQGGIFHHYKK
jgi:uncharacterized protein (TIGR02117 family)